MKNSAAKLQNAVSTHSNIANFFNVIYSEHIAHCLIPKPNRSPSSTLSTHLRGLKSFKPIEHIADVLDGQSRAQIVDNVNADHSFPTVDEITSSGLSYDTLTQFGYGAFYIVIFLAVLILLRQLFGFYISRSKQKQKTADACQEVDCKAKLDPVDRAALNTRSLANRSAANGWESEIIENDERRIGDEEDFWLSKRKKKQKSLYDKGAKSEFLQKKRACVSVGPVMLQSQSHEDDFEFLLTEKECVVAEKKPEMKSIQPQLASTYYVCVINFHFILFIYIFNLSLKLS